MARGLPICAACGSGAGVQEHHLVPCVHGGTGLPTVWLCYVCHGLLHGVERSAEHRQLVKAALAAAKARGVQFGRWKSPAKKAAAEARGEKLGPKPDSTVAHQAIQARADAFAAALLPLVRERRQAGASLRTIAAELTNAGKTTPRGGAWTAAAVNAVLARG